MQEEELEEEQILPLLSYEEAEKLSDRLYEKGIHANPIDVGNGDEHHYWNGDQQRSWVLMVYDVPLLEQLAS